jgi:hypothetical protein
MVYLTEIQLVIVKTLTDILVDDIKVSQVYAIILDESTDIGVEKRLCVCTICKKW